MSEKDADDPPEIRDGPTGNHNPIDPEEEDFLTGEAISPAQDELRTQLEGNQIIPTPPTDTEEPDPVSEEEAKQKALDTVRDALMAVNQIPASALDPQKSDDIFETAETLWSLERQLQNEVKHLRGDVDD